MSGYDVIVLVRDSYRDLDAVQLQFCFVFALGVSPTRTDLERVLFCFCEVNWKGYHYLQGLTTWTGRAAMNILLARLPLRERTRANWYVCKQMGNERTYVRQYKRLCVLDHENAYVECIERIRARVRIRMFLRIARIKVLLCLCIQKGQHRQIYKPSFREA